MSAKKAIKAKSANASANLYDGVFEVLFDCVGVDVCRYALCEVMPPTAASECCYREHGSCRRSAAQQAALELLMGKIKKELKQFEEE